MNRKYYIFLFLCIVAVATLTYYGINTNKEREVSYYVIKETSSCMAECEEGVKEIYTKYYSTEESEGVKAMFSETSGSETIGGYNIAYLFSRKIIGYSFDREGELKYKTVTTSDPGYFLWNLDSMEVGQKWEGNVTIKSDNIKNKENFITEYKFETEIVSYEKVKIEAGSFNCYKVRRAMSTEYEGEIVKQINTLWYSPELKIIVKGINTTNFKGKECTSTLELIEYR